MSDKVVKDFNGEDIILRPTGDDHEFSMSLAQAALALNVNKTTLLNHIARHKDELVKGVHWNSTFTNSERGGRSYESKVLYKRGLLRISMFVRSDVAAKFRQWLEDLVIDIADGRKTAISVNDQMQPLYSIRDTINELIQQRELQIQLENRVGAVENRVDGFHQKIENIEEHLANSPMDPDNAYSIKQQIQYIAYLLAKIDGESRAGHAHFSAAYRQFNEHFGIPKYSLLPQNKVAEAIGYLQNWKNGLVNYLQHK